jgi:hypothetical protein
MKILHNVAFYMGIIFIAIGVFGVLATMAIWCDHKEGVGMLFLRETLPALSMILGYIVGKISDEIN